MEEAIQDFLNTGAILSDSRPGKQDQIRIAWGACAYQAQNDPEKLSLFAPDYFLKSPLPWIVYDNWITLDKVDLHRLLIPWALLFTEEVAWQVPSRREFQADYDELKRAIQDGELHKGVPYMFEYGTIATGRAWRARTLIHLLEQANSSWIYGVWDEHEGIIGATPELLFEVSHATDPERGRLKTMALAGTQDIAEDAEELLRDLKQIHEHRVVVDDIVEKLRDLGDVFLQPMRVLELPRLRHLLTEIRVELSQSVHFEELARRLHPTAALGASPRSTGLKWLQKLDIYRPRFRFGAPFGAAERSSEAICLVAIRNVQWQDGELYLGAGCGVVKESRFDDEWEELALKRESTKRMLGL